MTITVGDTLYCRERYRFQGKWLSQKVTGETKGTWIVGNDTANKKTLLSPRDRQGDSTRYYTKDQMEDAIFCDQHARNIASAVSVASADQLRQIAAVLGKVLE